MKVIFLVGIPEAHVKRTIDRAHALGIKVIIGDEKQKLIKFQKELRNVDRTIAIDYKNYKLLYKKFSEINSEEKIDSILSFKEEALINTARIAEEFNLKGVSVDAVSTSISKYATRQRLKKHKIPSPNFCKCENYEELVGFWKEVDGPIILKPDNLQGSIGIYKVNQFEDLKTYFLKSLKASKSNFVLAEEYIYGKEISIEAMIFKNEVIILGVTEKHLYEGTYIESGHITPYKIKNFTIDKLKSLVKEVCDAININLGPLHIEAFISNDDLVIGEVHTRYGGDNIVTITELTNESDITSPLMADLVNIDYIYCENEVTNYVGIKFLEVDPGILIKIEGIETLDSDPNVVKYSINCSIGDRISPIESSFDRPGWVITKGGSKEELIKNMEEAFSNLNIVTKR